MTTVGQIFDYLNEIAPVGMRIGDDNVGLLVGRREAAVSKVLIALDITPAVIEEAKNFGAQLIVSHHPVIFGAIKSLTDRDYTGTRLIGLVENRIAAICMHTNLDVSAGGVNDALAEKIGLVNVETLLDRTLSGDVDRGVCRMGMVSQPCSVEAFSGHLVKTLGGKGVKYLDAHREVKKVAVGGGSCGGDIPLVAAAGCDTFVTADIKHSQMLEAEWHGINLIDAGHFPTEDAICPVLVKKISARFPELQAKKADSLSDIMSYMSADIK